MYDDDYHMQVSDICVMTGSTTDCHYSFDTWHVAKTLEKDLQAAAGKASTKALMPWIPHVKSHFWWCAVV